ncbi:MAG: hypothetical protein ACTS2F_18860 [Thainema sp.]
MFNLSKRFIGLGVAATGIVAGSVLIVHRANADFTIAYCDGDQLAMNVYRSGDPEAPDSTLKLRLYDRSDNVVFLDTSAIREPNPEGYTYSNERGENQWALFVPNNTTSQCSLTRNGELFDSGTVVQREPSSGD